MAKMTFQKRSLAIFMGKNELGIQKHSDHILWEIYDGGAIYVVCNAKIKCSNTVKINVPNHPRKNKL